LTTLLTESMQSATNGISAIGTSPGRPPPETLPNRKVRSARSRSANSSQLITSVKACRRCVIRNHKPIASNPAHAHFGSLARCERELTLLVMDYRLFSRRTVPERRHVDQAANSKTRISMSGILARSRVHDGTVESIMACTNSFIDSAALLPVIIVTNSSRRHPVTVEIAPFRFEARLNPIDSLVDYRYRLMLLSSWRRYIRNGARART
jgi:hypothetical protein